MVTATATGRRRRLFLIVGKLSVAVLLLYLVLRGVDLSELGSLLSQVSPQAFGAAVLLQVLGFALGALRWSWMLRSTGIRQDVVRLFPSYYLGIFCNIFLPTGIGGDVVRVLHARRLGITLRPLVASTLSDRLIGLAAMLVTGLAVIGLFPIPGVDADAKRMLLAMAAILAAGACLLASDRFEGLLTTLADRFRHTRRRRAVLDVIRSLHELRHRKALLASAFAVSVVAQSTISVSYWVLGLSQGIEQPLVVYLAAIPVVLLASTMPLSVGALGVREGVFVSLMVWAGTEKAHAVSVALTYLATLWCASLPGALVWLVAPGAAPESPAVPAKQP